MILSLLFVSDAESISLCSFVIDFSCGPCRLTGYESGKSHRILPISCASLSIIPQGSEHSAVIQSVDNSEKKINMETSSTISEVVDKDEKGDKDTCRHQNVSLTDCGDDGWSTIKDSTAEIIASEDKESDEYGYPLTSVLARSRHRDGSIYRDMDTWWKKEYRIANRNESK